MSKQRIVQALKDAALRREEIPTTTLNAIVDTVFDTIAGDLADGHPVQVHGFGTFGVKHREARKGRNPQTGKEIDIAASKTVGFKPAAKLKQRL